MNSLPRELYPVIARELDVSSLHSFLGVSKWIRNALENSPLYRGRCDVVVSVMRNFDKISEHLWDRIVNRGIEILLPVPCLALERCSLLHRYASLDPNHPFAQKIGALLATLTPSAQFDVPDDDGYTPLHYAERHKKPQQAEILRALKT
jgi:hypothetical protein